MSRPEAHLRLLPDKHVPEGSAPALVESYRRLADVFHEVLAEQSLDALLVRIAETLADLIPHDTMTIYEVDEAQKLLTPMLVRDQYAEEIMRARLRYEEGITGWVAARREAALVNSAHLDPRVSVVPGTPHEPEALVSIPLIARAQIKGVLNIYRVGEDVSFSEEEFELALRVADAAALAIDNAQIRARLEHQAQTDSLTGLFNHRSFHERLLHALHSASRTHEPIAVLMLDIDDFKRINDVHSHSVGDELLRALADALRNVVRPDDIVCRLGGEEFAVIMSVDAAMASRVAESIVGRIGQIDLPGIGSVTVSVGLAFGPEHAMNPRELAACAEAAMMTAKARGKNRIVLYEENATERPVHDRDVRSVAHMKMLQSLTGKLNRLNDVRMLGNEIAVELKTLIDYHNCRVYVVDGEELVPIAFRGEFTAETAALPLELLRGRVGKGITGTCAQRGESLLVGDAANCEFARVIPGTPIVDESLLAVPLRYGSRVVGVIAVSKLGLDQFDEDDVRLLEVLAGHAAVAVENASLYESARLEAERAKTLLEFSRELATARTLEEIFQRIVRLTSDLFACPKTQLWMEDGEGFIGPIALHGYDELDRVRLESRRLPVEKTRVYTTRVTPFLLRPDDWSQIDPDSIDPSAWYAVAPIDVDGRIGCIVAAVEADFGERELRLLGGLAHQARLAIANGTNYEGLERTFVSTVEALANALEAKDAYKSEHARSTADLSLRVGRELGLDDASLKRLELGALLHDIGKIGIPSEILGKPGPLTDEEQAVIETHPQLGEGIIAPIARLQDVRPIIRHSHERWDGGGYPDGLAGEDILLESRIIFACDAYHAMTTDGPYRPRLSPEEAARRLREAAGTQFDSRVVEAVLKIV